MQEKDRQTFMLNYHVRLLEERTKGLFKRIGSLFRRAQPSISNEIERETTKCLRARELSSRRKQHLRKCGRDAPPSDAFARFDRGPDVMRAERFRATRAAESSPGVTNVLFARPRLQRLLCAAIHAGRVRHYRTTSWTDASSRKQIECRGTATASPKLSLGRRLAA